MNCLWCCCCLYLCYNKDPDPGSYKGKSTALPQLMAQLRIYFKPDLSSRSSNSIKQSLSLERLPTLILNCDSVEEEVCKYEKGRVPHTVVYPITTKEKERKRERKKGKGTVHMGKTNKKLKITTI